MGRVSPAVMAHLPCLSPPPQPVPQHQLPEHELPVAGRLLSAMGVGREPLSRASRSPEGGRALRLFGQQRGELSGSLACCCAPRKQVGRKATAGRTSGSRRDTASLESGVPGAQGCCACSVVGDFPQAGGLPVWCRRELRAAAAALSSSTRNKLKALACSERYLKPIRIPLLLLPELCSLLSLIPTAVCCSA